MSGDSLPEPAVSVRQLIPWWARIATKVVLSRAPLDYRRWQKWGLFVHGAMDRPAYAFRVVKSHLERVGWSTCEGKVVLELGPGDSLATAVIARTFGAEKCYLVDAGFFATRDLVAYTDLQKYLEAQGMRPPDVASGKSLEEILSVCSAVYVTDGLRSLRRMPDASVDLVLSQAVLEHVRLADFSATNHEIRRLLRLDGVASHQVDLKDHLGGALNHLRFDQRTWEADWMVHSGFYTNRLRFSQIIDSMVAAGLDPTVTNIQRWPHLPTPRSRMAPHFRVMTDDELLVSQFDVVARRASRASHAA